MLLCNWVNRLGLDVKGVRLRGLLSYHGQIRCYLISGCEMGRNLNRRAGALSYSLNADCPDLHFPPVCSGQHIKSPCPPTSIISIAHASHGQRIHPIRRRFLLHSLGNWYVYTHPPLASHLLTRTSLHPRTRSIKGMGHPRQAKTRPQTQEGLSASEGVHRGQRRKSHFLRCQARSPHLHAGRQQGSTRTKSVSRVRSLTSLPPC